MCLEGAGEGDVPLCVLTQAACLKTHGDMFDVVA